jgi:hypothetical protein
MPLLTVAQFREHVTTTIPDAAVQTLLDAAEAAIVEVVGAPGAVTEYIDARPVGGGYGPWAVGTSYRRVSVGRPIATVTSVTEYVGDTAFVLDATDYRASGYVLTRLPHGTNPRERWGSRIVVVYAPQDEIADRSRVQIELVRLDLNAEPGLALQSVEGFDERYSGAGVLNYSQERADLLASLGSAAAGGMVVVGDEY